MTTKIPAVGQSRTSHLLLQIMPSTMLFRNILITILTVISSQARAQLSNITTPSLNLTALSASGGASILECWQLPGFTTSAQAGTSGALNLFLGDISNASYTVIPGRFDGGIHNAPAAQYVSNSEIPRFRKHICNVNARRYTS
jgi:hypothetical protein